MDSKIRNSKFKIQNSRSTCFLWFVACSFLVGCGTVHLDTPEPLKVDVSMKVDVYPHDVAGVKERKLSEEESKVMRSREERSGEIWTMKNDGVAVEGNSGYLEVKIKSGWDPQYVNRLVAEENHDRQILYEAEALASARPVKVIEEEAGKRLRQQSYGHSTPASK